MTTVAIVGAGPGLGAATARRFAAEGFEVALVSRGRERLDALAADLAHAGVRARGYVADVRDGAALDAALAAAAEAQGVVEVLQYSPLPHRDFLKPLAQTSRADLVAAYEFAVLGPLAALTQLLHHDLAADGIHVGQLIVPGSIVAGHPRKDPVVLAQRVWEMHTDRAGFRQFAEDLDA
jgi:NADP-dependent 3-hydroxy acid dehydrogenase YdfG